MKWRVLYHPDVLQEDLPKVPGNIRARLKRAIEVRLLQDPVWAGSPLRRDLVGYRKMRVGDYRIVYRIAQDCVLILLIGHRKDVYDRASERL